MNIDISFKNLDSSDAIKTYITEKTEKLNKYFDGRVHVTWNISLERQNRVVHCHLLGNNMDFFADEATNDLTGSIDLCVDKIEKQIRKHKEIVKDHHHKPSAAGAGNE